MRLPIDLTESNMLERREAKAGGPHITGVNFPDYLSHSLKIKSHFTP